MNYSSCLTDDLTPLVLDTSVLINLYASRSGEQILGSLPNDVLVPETVASELEHETSKIQGQHRFIQGLIATHSAEVAFLSGSEKHVFHRLVSEAPSLGDGEAATIAIAAHRNLVPIIDDRRGRARALEACSGRCLGWTVDLILHPAVVAGLGTPHASKALYFALHDGRMRIHEDHCDYVVNLIGVRHALECKSLPRYRERRKQWMAAINSDISWRLA